MVEQVLGHENLTRAWEQVRAKKGGPGIDRVTLARWGRNWEANIERLRHQVKTNTYRPNRPKRFFVRKKNGGFRELSRLTITDKVLQRAVLNVIDPLFERAFLECSHGYRQKRSVATAVEQILDYRERGYGWVFDADIEACFDSLDHELLMEWVRPVVDDWFVLNLMGLWLKAGRKHRNRAVGVPMGAVISPLWCNLYLHQLDVALALKGRHAVRYADDFVVFARSAEAAEEAWLETESVLAGMKLRLAERKTMVRSFETGFVFLGVTFWQDMYSYVWKDEEIMVRGKKLGILYTHVPTYA